MDLKIDERSRARILLENLNLMNFEIIGQCSRTDQLDQNRWVIISNSLDLNVLGSIQFLLENCNLATQMMQNHIVVIYVCNSIIQCSIFRCTFTLNTASDCNPQVAHDKLTEGLHFASV